MMMRRSKSIVTKIRTKADGFWVAFSSHDGYFFIPVSADTDTFVNKLRHAQQTRSRVDFGYDGNLTILDVNFCKENGAGEGI